MASEVWRWIEGYEGLYMVSNLGRLMSVPNDRNATGPHCGRELSQSKCNSGYLKVVLTKDGKQRNVMTHRAVAKAFVQGFKPGREVNHKDGDKLNNRADNLEWATRSENVKHSYDKLGHKRPSGSHPVKITEQDAREIFNASGTNKEIGERYGISDVMVGLIKRRKSWKEATCQSIK